MRRCPRAAAGAVTQVAIALGYSSSSAFATVFKRVLGEVPSRYMAESAGSRRGG
ncbi:helix-turn-helix domain-containing protein [Pseudomonas shirazensis]|uniref:Helix-turn-helix domain-containing protein n=1 Tax=Pseudomonas shirazensis TaxID=2745494 RepID=A0ABU9A4W5_9PSED